jgi:cytochrome c oxidase subunit IV
MSSEHIVPVRTYLVIFTLLMVLTALTTAVAFVDLGVMNVVIMLVIAFTKAAVVVLYFMHVRFSSPLTKVVAASGFAWLTILIALTLSDVLTRNILP